MDIRSLLNCFSILAFLACQCIVSTSGEKKMVCYFTNWSKWRQMGGRYKVQNIDPFLCTHLVFAFSKVIGTTLQAYEAGDDKLDGGAWKEFNALKLKNPKLKTLLAVGGWTHGTKPFSEMVATQTSRDLFIKYTIILLRQFNFDGLDIDWEYPGSVLASDKAQFVLFLRELREKVEAEAKATNRPRLLLSAAVAAGIKAATKGYDVPTLMRTLDYISIMTFDYHGAWEKKTGHLCPLRGQYDGDTLNVVSSLKWYLAQGGIREKMVVSIPLYARTWTLADPNDIHLGATASGAGKPGFATRTAGLLSHYEVCDLANKGLYTYHDTKADAVYGVYGDQWITYESLEGLRRKLDYIFKEGFAGVMTWSLDHDDFQGWYCNQGKNPMLSLIKERVQKASLTQVTSPQPPASTVPPITTRPVNPSTPSYTPPITKSPTQDPSDPDTFECPDEYGVFRAPHRCDMYYICYAMQPFQVRCQGSAHYNPETHRCQDGYVCPEQY